MYQDRTAHQANSPLDGDVATAPKLSLQIRSHGWSSPAIRPALPRSYAPLHGSDADAPGVAWHQVPISRSPVATLEALQTIYESAPEAITDGYLGQRAHASHQLFLKVAHHVETHLTGDVSLSALAKAVGLRKASCTRLVRENSGKSIAAFVRERRVSKALELLRSSHDRLGEIAVICGFSSQSYFSQIIRHKTGQSPLTYRRLHLRQLYAGGAK